MAMAMATARARARARAIAIAIAIALMNGYWKGYLGVCGELNNIFGLLHNINTIIVEPNLDNKYAMSRYHACYSGYCIFKYS